MELTLERKLQLRLAEDATAGFSQAELRDALSFAWRRLLLERQQAEAVLSDATGLAVTISGPLLRQKASGPRGGPSQSISP